MYISPYSHRLSEQKVAYEHKVFRMDDDEEIICMSVNTKYKSYCWLVDKAQNIWQLDYYMPGELYLKNLVTGFKTVLL